MPSKGSCMKKGILIMKDVIVDKFSIRNIVTLFCDLYTPATKLGGYTGITLSVCL